MDVKQLLKKLVEHWRFWDVYEAYYLENLTPKLIADPGSGDETEVALLFQIRHEIGPEDWKNLAALIREYRAESARQEEREREALLRAQEERRREELRCEAERKEKERKLEAERQERARREREKKTLLERLRDQFQQNFLNTWDFYQAQCSAYISFEEYEAEKVDYVRSWVERHLDFVPDPEQAAAIGAVEGHVQVVARAGSGKTTTLVHRALFLQQHCGVSPSEMLLLAFNKEVAEEMQEGLTSKGSRLEEMW